MLIQWLLQIYFISIFDFPNILNMATFKFLQRSTVTDKPATIYFLIVNGRDFKLTLKTPYSVEPQYWKQTEQTVKFGKRPSTVIEKNKKTELDNLNNILDKFKSDFKIFFNNSPNSTKEEIQNYFNTTYFSGKIEAKKISAETSKPQKFTDFIELYIREKSESLNGEQTPISEGTIKSYTRVKNHIKKVNPNLLISEVDNGFRKTYAKYCEKEQYKLSYQTKHLGYIKTFCKYAFENLGYDNISNEVLRWEFKNAKKKIRESSILHPIFTFDEVNSLRNHIFQHDYLTNARDWLIISIFTGQRVSDFLNFSKSKIVEKKLLEMVQKKTGSGNTIFLLPDVISILKKRDGEFPRKISDQRYNEYIKKVCELVGIDEIIEGEKTLLIELDGKKVKRNVRGHYPKHQLVTSHIGRRSFVSIAMQMKISETAIMQQTGHKSIEILQTYNQTNAIDKAKINGKELSKLRII